MTPLRISGKNLGQLALADACERCFWVKLRCGNKLPYQIFPGIFASIDSMTKKVTAAHFARHGAVPEWFNELGDISELVPVPHHSKFCWQDPATGILLTGVPDELVRLRNKSLAIIDYKTARYTEHQDTLLPMYQTQLNSYAVIAERIGMGNVSGLALIYYEPQTAVGADDIGEVVSVDGFNMRFNAKVLPVELALDSIPPLLAKARAIYDLQNPPTGREGCKDCRLLAGLVELLTSSLPHEEQFWELLDRLSLVYFERGIASERNQDSKSDSEERRLRTELMAAVRQLRGGKVSG